MTRSAAVRPILFVDNQDSFVWNLVDYVSQFYAETAVRSNRITLAEVAAMQPLGIVISPGPGHPANARDIGSCLEIIKQFGSTPILGVCLGHQAMNIAYGGTIAHTRPLHGKISQIEHDGKGIFRGLENPMVGGRYHSLAIEKLSPELEVSAKTADGIIMGVRHKSRPHCWAAVSSRVGADAIRQEADLQLDRGCGSMHPLIDGILAATRARGFEAAAPWPKEERRDLIASARALKSRGFIPIIAEIKPKALGRALSAEEVAAYAGAYAENNACASLRSHRAHALSRALWKTL